MPFTVVRQDITKMNVDAVVCASNTALTASGGVSAAIFEAAGEDRLREECKKLAPIEVGGVAITAGYSLPAKYIIHTAGPVYSDQTRELNRRQLRAAYINSLEAAVTHDCKSIAFPLISGGSFGYPKAEALETAREAIRAFLTAWDIDVYLVVYGSDTFEISGKLLGAVESYIDEHYVEAHRALRNNGAFYSQAYAAPMPEEDDICGALEPRKGAPLEAPKTKRKAFPSPDFADAAPMPAEGRANAESSARPMPAAAPAASLEELVRQIDAPFSEMLFKLIDAKGRRDVEVYKRANIDRRLFSKIRSVMGYTPKKQTILALAVSLELTLPETDALLERAGYALSHASKFDVIVEYFIVSGNYDIFEINEVLFSYDQPLLGG